MAGLARKILLPVLSSLPEGAQSSLRRGWQKLRGRAPNRAKGSRNQIAQQHLKLGRAYLSHWQIVPAFTEINRSIGANYMNGEAHRLHSYVLEIMGDLPAARRAAKVAFHSDPLSVQSFQLLAKHGLRDDIARGRADIEAQVARRKWTAAAVLRGCGCLLDLGDPDQAEALLRKAAENGTSMGERDRNMMLAQIRMAQRNISEAAELLEKLLDDPRLGLRAAQALGEALMEMDQFKEAEEIIDRANTGIDVGRTRGFSTPLYLMRFKTGKTRAAFHEARHRPFTAALREDVDSRYFQYLPELRVVGSACVVSDFGIGDEIRFASIYADLLKYKPALTITCDPRLQTLLTRSFPGTRFVPVRRWRAEMPVTNPESRAGMPSRRLTPHLDRAALDIIESSDAFTSIFDMLAELRPDHAAFTRDQAAYLVPDRTLAASWRENVTHKSVKGLPNIALSWRSLLRNGTRNLHYLDPEDLRPLSKIDAVFWLFQPGLEKDEIACLQKILPHVRIIEGLDLIDDFEGQAAFLTQMDHVIAPCTTSAELSAALGVQTLMFGRTFSATWRSDPDGQDLWHPTLRLVTGTPIADRAATVGAIVNALHETPAYV